MAMTTKSSINVNPDDLRIMKHPPFAIQSKIYPLSLPGYTVELSYYEYTKIVCQMQQSLKKFNSAEKKPLGEENNAYGWLGL
jgi:hypothetical protein